MNPYNNQWQESSDIGTKEGCRQLDSCSPGGGDGSDGGCYKWATSIDEQVQPW